MSNYLLLTSRKPSACLGCAFGNFDGSQTTSHLVLNRLNRLEFWECPRNQASMLAAQAIDAGGNSAGASAAAATAGLRMALEVEFPFNAAIRHLVAVPIPAASTKATAAVAGAGGGGPRLALLLVTDQQDVCIVAVRRAAGSSTPLELVTLYSGELRSSLFFRQIGQPCVIAATGPAAADQTDEDAQMPLVAVSFYRNFVVLIDVAACIVDEALRQCAAVAGAASSSEPQIHAAAAAQKRARDDSDDSPTHHQALLRSSGDGLAVSDTDLARRLQGLQLFSMAFVQSHLTRRRGATPFSFCPVAEAEPRSLCFLRLPSIGRALLILHQDPKGRSHVRRYTVAEGPNSVTVGAKAFPPSTTPAQQQHLAEVFTRAALRCTHYSTAMALRSPTTVQGDVEADAALLHPFHGGVLIVGSALATFVNCDRKLHVATAVTPSPACRCEPVAAITQSQSSCIVAFATGAVAAVSFDGTDLVVSLLAPLSTPVACFAAVGPTYCFVGSALQNSVLLHRFSGAVTAAIDNVGPIIEMAAVRGPPTTIVAATGVEQFGSLQTIRSGIPVIEECVATDLHGILSLHSAPLPLQRAPGGDRAVGLLALSAYCSTQLLVFDEHFALDEVEVVPEPTLCVARLGPDTALLVTPSGASVLRIATGAASPPLRGARTVFDSRATSAAVDPQAATLVVACGRTVAIYELPSLQLLHAVAFPRDVACLEMTRRYEVIVGLWGSDYLWYFTADCLEPFIVARLPEGRMARSVVVASLPARPVMAAGPSCDAEADDSGGWGEAHGSDGDKSEHQRRHFVIGLVDGSLAVCEDEGLPRSPAMPPMTSTHLAFGRHPVTVRRAAAGVVAISDTTGIVFAPPGRGVTIVGLGSRPVDAWVPLSPLRSVGYDSSAASLTVLTWSPNCSRGGAPSRVNASSVAVRQTAPKMLHVADVDGVFIALRDRSQDRVALYSPPTALSKPFASWPLLEAERCEFLGWVSLGGEPFMVGPDERPSDSHSRDSTVSGLLVGTNFVYPRDDVPRNGRIVLLGIDPVRPSALVQIADRDIRGVVLAACPIPRTNDRILVGVTGSVQVFRWSPSDRAFHYEVSMAVGSAITKLIPLSGTHIGPVRSDAQRGRAAPLVMSTPALTGALRPQQPPALPPQTAADEAGADDNALPLPLPAAAAAEAAPLPPGPAPPEPEVLTVESSLVLCADMRTGITLIGLNAVDLIKVEACELHHREVMDVLAAPGPRPGVAAAYDPDLLVADTDLNLVVLVSRDCGGPTRPRRLEPRCQIHIGDRITCLQRGSFATTTKLAGASRQAAPLAPAGSPLVYGTAHGAVGSLVPLSGVAARFLEAAAACLTPLAPAHGGLSIAAFRRVVDKFALPIPPSHPQFFEPPAPRAPQLPPSHPHPTSLIDGDMLLAILHSPQRKTDAGRAALFAAVDELNDRLAEQQHANRASATGDDSATTPEAGPAATNAMNAAALPEDEAADLSEALLANGLPAFPVTVAALIDLLERVEFLA